MTVSLHDKWLFLGAVMGDSALPGSAKSVAYFLLDHFNTQTGRCDPSLVGLAERMGMSRRSTTTGIAALIAAGYFERIAGGGRGVRTKYQPCWETGKQASQYQDAETGKQSVINREVKRHKQGSMLPTNPGRNREEAIRPSAPPPPQNKYAFKGAVVRLTQEDFNTWEKSYSNIPNLTAVLQNRDDWLAGRPERERKNWYQSTSNVLAKKDAEFAKATANGVDADSFNGRVTETW